MQSEWKYLCCVSSSDRTTAVDVSQISTMAARKSRVDNLIGTFERKWGHAFLLLSVFSNK